MRQLHIFLDTNVMPRDLSRSRHDFEQLAELVREKLAQVHMSEIAAREWRSQRVAAFVDHVREMHTALRKVKYNQFTSALKHQKLIDRMVADKDATVEEATNAVLAECGKLTGLLGVNEVKIEGKDAKEVFEDYFNGEPPFATPKSREDIPDAFILRAARRVVAHMGGQTLYVVCKDKGLTKALKLVKGVQVFKSLIDLYASEVAKGAMQHLEHARVWNEKKVAVEEFLKKHPKRVAKLIDDYLNETIQGSEFTDAEIPVDNNEAYIRCVFGVDELKVRWNFVKEVGPGWLMVPFSFKTESELDVHVFRSDAFSMPDWIDVDVGDFESDYYFDGTACRTLEVTGNISFRFSKEDLEAEKLTFPKDVEFDDVKIGLQPLPRDEYDPD